MARGRSSRVEGPCARYWDGSAGSAQPSVKEIGEVQQHVEQVVRGSRSAGWLVESRQGRSAELLKRRLCAAHCLGKCWTRREAPEPIGRRETFLRPAGARGKRPGQRVNLGFRALNSKPRGASERSSRVASSSRERLSRFFDVEFNIFACMARPGSRCASESFFPVSAGPAKRLMKIHGQQHTTAHSWMDFAAPGLRDNRSTIRAAS